MKRVIHKWLGSVVTIAAVTICLSTQSFALVSSGQIAPADGISGQDIIVGNGVKTGHIQDGSVTDAKIVSISAEKIAGIIGVDKIASYAGVKIVHKGAVDGVNTFTTIAAAVQAIGANTAERYAIVVMPGVYTEDFSFFDAAGTFNMDIIGASRSGSYLKATGNHWRAYDPSWRSYLHLANGLFLKNLSFEGIVDIGYTSGAGIVDCDLLPARAPQGAGYAIMGHGPKSVTVENVYIETDQLGMWLYAMGDGNPEDGYIFNNIRIHGVGTGAEGIWAFPSNTSRPIRFSNITMTSTISKGFTFYSYSGGETELYNITFSGSGSPFQYGGSGWHRVNARNCNFNSAADLVYGGGNSAMAITIDNSTIKSTVSGSASPVKIGGSKIIAPITSSNGSVKIINSYNGNYDAIPNGTY